MGSLDQFLADLDDLNEEQQAEEGDELSDDGDLEDGDDEDIDMLDDTQTPRMASGLLTSERMQQLMERIEEMMCDAPAEPGSAEEADVYNMIVQCNEMVIDVDNEIEAIAKTIRASGSLTKLWLGGWTNSQCGPVRLRCHFCNPPDSAACERSG